MERKDVMSKNVAIYKAQASALEKGANPGCKVGPAPIRVQGSDFLTMRRT